MKLDSLLAQTLLATARQQGAAAELRCLALLARAACGEEIETAFQRELARSGLTESGFAVMSVLHAHHPQAVLRSDMATAAGLSPMRTDDALMRLEMSRLVRRHRDEQDRRLVWLSLSAGGLQQIISALARYVAGTLLVTGSLNEQELTSSVEISGKLRMGAAQLSRESSFSTPS